MHLENHLRMRARAYGVAKICSTLLHLVLLLGIGRGNVYPYLCREALWAMECKHALSACSTTAKVTVRGVQH